jgi:hypothetical protein
MLKKTKPEVRRASAKPVREADVQLMPQQKLDMPKIEPTPRIEFDLDGSEQWLKHMRQTAEFICTIEWSWSPLNERKESYYLQRGRTHWILWLKRYDDNWGKWEKPVVVARCPGKEIGRDKDAAMILLAGVFSEAIRHYNSDPGPFDINDAGLLSMWELDVVSDTVWGAKRGS